MTAASRTVLTTASGKLIDLLHPKAEDIIIGDVIEHLSKEARYNGATASFFYSVAEHLARGADAIFAETGDPRFAAYFLLHDFPEAYLKDDPTPKKNAIASLAQAEFGVLSGTIIQAFDSITGRFDVACHAAAGLAWPPPPDIAAAVRRFDVVMLLTEWRDLKCTPMPFEVDPGIWPLPDIIRPWSWTRARFELEARCQKWLPAVPKKPPRRPKSARAHL